MRIGSPSVEGVLVGANLVATLVLGGVYLAGDSGASPSTAPDVHEAHREGRSVLVVVAADSPTDAAVGRPVADAMGGALLAVSATGLTAAMTAELSRSRPDEVLVLGGPAAVTEATASAVGQYASGSVTRLAGADRFSTAAKVATSQFPDPVQHVRILSGDEVAEVPLPDSGEEGSNTPVLLVERDRIPASSAAALRELRPRSIDVLAGPGAVSDAVVQQLQAYTSGQVVRRR